MKHKVLTLLLATALLANLVGCATPSKTAQPDETSNNEVIADPLSSGTTPTEADEDKGSGGEDLGGSGGEVESRPQFDPLTLAFESAYLYYASEPSSSFEEHLEKEIGYVVELASSIGVLPDNYREVYTNWRIENFGRTFIQGTQAQAPQATFDFTECNETVYATGTVNLRSGPSTDNDKVGSLSAGQSATRTGIGTGTADGWSRIQTADGKTVYVSSNYLSTSKPVQSQNKGTTATPANTGTSKSGTSTSNQSSGGLTAQERAALEAAGLTVVGEGEVGPEGRGDRADPRFDGMTEQEILDYLTESQKDLQFRINGT